jgi:hypothetical protein
MGLLTHDDVFIARSPEDAAQAQAAGHPQCYTAKVDRGIGKGGPCPVYLPPPTVSHVTDNMGGYFTCPNCKVSHDLLHDIPWHGVPEEEYNPEAQQEFNAGGGTRIGLPMSDQSQIGEDLVHNLGELPGYGPITWWHEGGSLANSPLDGAVEDWGIEVKTLGYDAMHHRYVPGRKREKLHKNEMALAMGKKGVLGVLVLLDYRRSVADIYVQEHPVVADENGQIIQGTRAFRTNTGMHLVKEVPFKNPLMDPTHPAPVQNQQQVVGHDDKGIPVDAEGYAVF